MELRERRIPLEGAENFRDLGGYQTPQGLTAWGRLFRADALAALTEPDCASLLHQGLRTVVDLRRPPEAATHPDVFVGHPSVRYRQLPLEAAEAPDLTGLERLGRLDFRAHYLDMLQRNRRTFEQLFELLADPGAYPLVFHCTAGRDRTGLVAALVLTAAGVSRQEVVADYLLSNAYVRRLLDAIRRAAIEQGLDPEPLLAHLTLRGSALEGTLEALEAEHGGVAGYLHAAGVSSVQLESFRRLFVPG